MNLPSIGCGIVTGITVTVVLLLFSSSGEVHGANIFGYLVTPGRSHFIIHNSLLMGLAEKGHNVSLLIYIDC